MFDLKEKLKRLAAFDERFKSNPHLNQTTHIRLRGVHDGRIAENARLQPLIEALIAVAEAADAYCSGQNAPSQICSLSEVRRLGLALDAALTALEKLSGGGVRGE